MVRDLSLDQIGGTTVLWSKQAKGQYMNVHEYRSARVRLHAGFRRSERLKEGNYGAGITALAWEE